MRDMDYFDHLPSVTLHEVNKQARLQTRVDRKYLLHGGDPAAQQALLAVANAGQDNGTQVLDTRGMGQGNRSNGYVSHYYDTQFNESYHLSAHGDPGRFKVRTRRYDDTGEEFVEVKVREGKQTVKYRAPLPGKEAHMNSVAQFRSFVTGTLADHGIKTPVDHMEKVLRVGYDRTTLLLPETESRVTIDEGLAAKRLQRSFDHLINWRETETDLDYGDLIVVETKTAPGVQSEVDEILQSRDIMPVRFSKYCTSRALIEPALPKHRWREALTNHLTA